MKKLLISLTVGLVTAGSAYAQAPLTASGEVVAVRVLTRTIRVRDAAADEVIRYSVPSASTVTFAGQGGRLGYLRSGDRVNIEYVNTDDGREAAIVRVPQPTPAMDLRVSEGEMSTITGRIERVDTRNRTLTVLGDQSGERFTYAIPEGTRVTVTGQNARLGQLRRGDEVTLRFRRAADARTAARVRVPRTTTPLAQRPNQTTPASVAGQPQRTQLPRTAGSLPLLGLIGLTSLFGAALVRFGRRRTSVNS